MGQDGQRSEIRRLSERLGLPEPIESDYAASDGTKFRYVVWRTAVENRLGGVLYLNGRTEFIEKTMATYALLVKSGLDVWTLDWRGQGLSERALADPQKGHISDYQVYLNDLDQFVSEITDLTSRPGKKIMLAHSMGGHIGLRYLHDRRDIFDYAVFSAPMIDLPVNNLLLRMINHLLIWLGCGKRYALGTKPFKFVYENPDDASDNGEIGDYRARIKQFEMLTGDAGKFMEIQRILRENPALALGGPTATWLDATFRSINLTWRKAYAEAIITPVLIVGGGRDRVVVTSRQEEMAMRMPNATFLKVEKAAHEFLVECDDARLTFLEAFAKFTGVPMPLPPADMAGCARQ